MGHMWTKAWVVAHTGPPSMATCLSIIALLCVFRIFLFRMTLSACLVVYNKKELDSLKEKKNSSAADA